MRAFAAQAEAMLLMGWSAGGPLQSLFARLHLRQQVSCLH